MDKNDDPSGPSDQVGMMPAGAGRPRRKYVAPTVHTETTFETAALACPKSDFGCDSRSVNWKS